MLTDLPLELIIGEIIAKDRLVYHPLVLAYPAFARSLTIIDRLDFAEKFGYNSRTGNCRVMKGGPNRWFAWYLDGKRHRIGGPATEYINGNKCWLINGNYHREDGPAIDHVDGEKQWFINGKRHRIDGPAYELGCGYKEWHIDGELIKRQRPLRKSGGTKKWYMWLTELVYLIVSMF